jgi:hypothetical protein
MNYPAASCGVSEKPELLTMQLHVVNILICDVPFNAGFIAMLPNRAHVVSVAPKLPSPKLLLYLRTRCQYLPCGNALDDLHDLLRTIHRHRLYQEVHMVLVCANLYECHLVSFTDFQTCLCELLVHRRRKYYSAIFCRTYNVIQKHRNIMTLVNIAAHTSHYIAIAASCGELTRSD